MKVNFDDTVYAIPHGVFRDKDLDHHAVLLFSVLACIDQTEGDGSGVVTESKKRVISLARQCDRSYKKAVEQLERKGWLTVESGKDKGAFNTYHIHYEREVQ